MAVGWAKTILKKQKAKNYIKTGDIGTFFITKTLGTEHLLGRVPTKFDEEWSKVLDNLNCISKFLSEYQAMSTLSDNSTANIAYYLPTIREFEQTQFDRQSAGLRTKKNSDDAEEMTKTVESYCKAERDKHQSIIAAKSAFYKGGK